MSASGRSAMDSLIRWLRSRPLLFDSLLTSAFIVMGRAGGLLVPFILAAWFGAGTATDAFFLSYTLILSLQAVFALALESVAVPFFGGQIVRGENPGRFAGRLMAIGTASMGGLLLVLLLLQRPLFAAVTGFDPSAMRLFGRLLWEISPFVPLTLWSSILCGLLNAHRRFILPAISPLLRTLVVIGFAFLFRGRLGIHAVAFGVVLGELARLLALFAAALRLPGCRIRISLGLDPELKAFFGQAFFQMAAVAAFHLNHTVDRAMAARLGEGQLSILHYAERLYMVPLTFIVYGIMVPVLAHWSERYAREGMPELRRSLRAGRRGVGLFALGLTLLFYLGRGTILRLALGHGRFPAADLDAAGRVFFCFLLGLAPAALYSIYLRALLIIRRTRPVMIGALATILLNLFFNIVGRRLLGVAGIALSTSLVNAIYLAFLWILFQKESAAGGRSS